MKNKISLLIYKKLDNSITDKEQKLLNKYLEENKKFQEEYKFINNISEELKNNTKKELPADFKIKLREKLVNYNLNKDSDSPKRKFFPITTCATLITAIFLVVFAFNNTETSKGNVVNENYGVVSEYTNNEHTELKNSKQKAVSEPAKADLQVADKTDTLTTYNTAKNNVSNAENEPSVIDEDTSFNLNTASYENEGNSGGGGGGNSHIALTASEYTDYIIIKTNCDISLFSDIKSESLMNNTYKISMTDYEKVKEILKNIPFEIQNENEENLLKDYFIIEITQ